MLIFFRFIFIQKINQKPHITLHALAVTWFSDAGESTPLDNEHLSLSTRELYGMATNQQSGIIK